MRRLMGWLVLISFVVWGPLDAMPCAAIRHQPDIASQNSTSHSSQCRCKDCLGARQCCCTPQKGDKTKGGKSGTALTADCDRPLPQTLVAKIKHQPMLLTAHTLQIASVMPVIPTPIHFLLCTNTFSPLRPPPRAL